MNRILLFALAIVYAVTALSASATQPSPEDERRAAITLLRAINTAEAAVHRSGHYVSLSELIDHPSMSRVKPDIVINGASASYQSAQVRLALSADATQYIVTVTAPSYTAAFTDERGVIYMGKALE